MWSHNLLVLIQRHVTAGAADADKALSSGSGDEADARVTLSDGDAEAAVTLGDAGCGGCGLRQAAQVPACSSDHARLPWAAATVFVVSYSFLLSMSVPYFSTLVGIVASSTYLICAYT